MSTPLEVCRACGKMLPKLSMSKVDDTLCVRCASKLIARAQLDDGSWLDDGLSLGIKHWEQFPNEPRAAYNAFCIYRDAYPKELSVREISQTTGLGENGIRHWMKRWRWKERFFEWSKKCDYEALAVQRDIRQDMNDRQIKTSQRLLQMAFERLENIDIDELGPKDVLAFADLAAKMERTAITDNRQLVEQQIESKQISLGIEKKADNGSSDKGMEEILNILASAGAININTTITTPRVVEGDEVECEEAVFEEIRDECQDSEVDYYESDQSEQPES